MSTNKSVRRTHAGYEGIVAWAPPQTKSNRVAPKIESGTGQCSHLHNHTHTVTRTDRSLVAIDAEGRKSVYFSGEMVVVAKCQREREN